MQSALPQLRHHPLASIVPGLRLAMRVRAFMHPVQPVLRDPIRDGDRLRHAQQRKIEHHPILKQRPRVHLAALQLKCIALRDRIISGYTPTATQSLQNVIDPKKHRPWACAFDQQFAGVDLDSVMVFLSRIL